MAILLTIIVTILIYFKENKLGQDLGGVRKDSMALVGYL